MTVTSFGGGGQAWDGCWDRDISSIPQQPKQKQTALSTLSYILRRAAAGGCYRCPRCA